MTLNFPSDFRSSLEFRRLQSALPESPRCVATDLFVTVFQAFMGAMAEGGEPGRLKAADREILVSDLEQTGKIGAGGETVLSALISPVKLLVLDGDDLLCPMFERCNRQTNGGGAMQSMGGRAAAYSKRLGKLEKNTLSDSLTIPPEILVDDNQVPLDSDTVNRIRKLITRCDLALKKPFRSGGSFTAELVANALAVTKNQTDEDIETICKTLVKHRASANNSGHPALIGMNTEKLLPKFGEMKSILGEPA